MKGRFAIFLLGSTLCAFASAFATSAGARSTVAVGKPPTHLADACGDFSEGARDVRVSWGAPTATTGCFFFAGPGQLGRDDSYGDRARLTRRGTSVRLAFGDAVFTGQISGDRVRLTRRSEHTFSTVWVADEVIEGRLVGERAACQRLDAAYSYNECDTANRSQCPGTCRIGAPVTVNSTRGGIPPSRSPPP